MTEGCHAGFLCFVFSADGLVSQPPPPSCNHHQELVINLGKKALYAAAQSFEGANMFHSQKPHKSFSMQQHVVIIITLLHP